MLVLVHVGHHTVYLFWSEPEQKDKQSDEGTLPAVCFHRFTVDLVHLLECPVLGVLHPAAADGSSQVKEAAAGGPDGGDWTEPPTAHPFSHDPTRSQVSNEKERHIYPFYCKI